jgi:hypothetical protein
MGVSDAPPTTLGIYVDPAARPSLASPASTTVGVPALAVASTASGTVDVPAAPGAALFVLADAGSLVDEQSETDNLAWSIPMPTMTGQPIATPSTVAEGGVLDVTVPVSASVRRIEVYLGSAAGGGNPGPLLGSATGNAGGEGTIQGTFPVPPGSAGDWYVWIATYDGYDLQWLGYLSFAPVSSTYYTLFDPTSPGPPSAPTSIPLTAVTVTP